MVNPNIGSDFDEFLKEDGKRREITMNCCGREGVACNAGEAAAGRNSLPRATQFNRSVKISCDQKWKE